MAKKIALVNDSNGSFKGWLFWCPGCSHAHVAFVGRWTFNGDFDKPTFSPSLLNRCPDHPDPTQRCCHLFVRDGKIQYLGDCTHALAGRTVDMEDLA